MDSEVTRAVGILNAAMQHNMFPQGGIPESDSDKLVEAEKMVALARQAQEVVEAVGAANVPNYQAIKDILLEAEVFVGVNEQPVVTEQPQPMAQQPTSDRLPAQYDVWDDANGGRWLVLRDLGTQLEVQSTTSGEKTLVPGGFLRTYVSTYVTPVDMTEDPHVGEDQSVVAVQPEPVEAEDQTPWINLVVKPEENGMYYTHPGCGSWMVPLDDVILPEVGDERECDSCCLQLPIRSVEANGYVSPHHDHEHLVAGGKPSISHSSSSPTGGQPSSSFEQPLASATSQIETGLVSASSTSSSSSSYSPSSEASLILDDNEDDPVYADLLERVEGDWTPFSMPAPHDLEDPPTMPDDLTENDGENRRLHSQFNALASRARYLGGIERAKARDCGRVRKQHMKRAMKDARGQLGKDATVTEVTQLAEADDQVSVWDARIARHGDRAEAYKEFFEIYAQNVAVLSRDLTWAQVEESGSGS